MKRTILLLTLAALGVASPAGFGLNGVGLHGINGVYNNVGLGAAVTETVVTPFHRTDAVSVPGRGTIVHTSPMPAATNLGLTNGYVSGAPFLSGGVGFLGNSGVTGEGYLTGTGVVGTGMGGLTTGAGVLGGGCTTGAGVLGGGLTTCTGVLGRGCTTGAGVLGGGLTTCTGVLGRGCMTGTGVLGGGYTTGAGVLGAGIGGTGCASGIYSTGWGNAILA